MIVTTEKERKILQEGGKILGAILYAVGQKSIPGVSLLELNEYAKKRMSENGVESSFFRFGSPPFPAVLCISVNEDVVHGIPNEYILKNGDILTLDGGIWHDGLCTDSAITVGVGTVSKKDTDLMHAAYEARAAQIEAAIAGNTIGDIGAASQRIAKQYGYGFPEELGGHGVGKKVHEPPFVATNGRVGEGETLIEGQVLALEPILVHGNGRVHLADDQWLFTTVDGTRSAQYEHTVIIGTNSAEVLTQTPQELNSAIQ